MIVVYEYIILAATPVTLYTESRSIQGLTVTFIVASLGL